MMELLNPRSRLVVLQDATKERTQSWAEMGWPDAKIVLDYQPGAGNVRVHRFTNIKHEWSDYTLVGDITMSEMTYTRNENDDRNDFVDALASNLITTMVAHIGGLPEGVIEHAFDTAVLAWDVRQKYQHTSALEVKMRLNQQSGGVH